jgi:hypothetical protein
LISALDPATGHLKRITAADADIGARMTFDVLERAEVECADDPYGAAIGLWIGLTRGMLAAGVPYDVLCNQVISVAAQGSCAGTA